MLPPALTPLARFKVRVGPVVSLGDTPSGQRRVVHILGGEVEGPVLAGEILAGGADWQWSQPDGLLDISAHYMIRTRDGALIEVRSEGLRHGPPEVLARLSRGEAVPREAYFFRTLIRFTTGAPPWLHLNRVMAIAAGERQVDAVVLDVFQLG